MSSISKPKPTGLIFEQRAVDKFNTWRTDPDARILLCEMGYDPEEIERLDAVKILGIHKTDIQIQIKLLNNENIIKENISIKSVTKEVGGFNQIERGEIDRYAATWDMPEDVVKIFKLFTGKTPPPQDLELEDDRRVKFHEFSQEEREKISQWITENQEKIIPAIFCGEGEYAAKWILVIINKPPDAPVWSIKSMQEVVDFMKEDGVSFTNAGSVKIGKITLQRKGGDRGREGAKQLQFKFNPLDLIM